jgi:SSS family solute:Na+ symporter
MLFGAPILGVWYWCTDQYIVQRALSAKNSIIARKGALFAGYLKILPVFIFFLPGVIAFALMQKGIINFSLDNADQALPVMISNFLPVGIKGIAIAGLLAALMSSLSSAFNSSSTLLTIDFYQKFRPKATDSQLVSFGRISTFLLVLISMGWIPFMKTLMTGGIFHYLQSIQAYISPPIASVFLFGLLYNWINSKGAIICLWTGFIIGIVRLVLEFLSKEGTIIVSKETLLFEFLQINFLHFALFLFILCSIILIVFSKLTSKQITKNIDGLTIGTRERISDSQKFNDIFFSIILVIIVLLLWLLFSPLVMG